MPFLKKVVSLWSLITLVIASILPLVLMPSKALASTNIDLATTTNYNLRYDGAAANSGGLYNIISVDLNNNGQKDLIIVDPFADFNSRTNSGSFYIVYDSLIDDYTGTGNNIDLNTTTNYNLRYDGPQASGVNGNSNNIVNIADLDNDGKQDILVSFNSADNTRTDSGSLYVIYNTLIDDYTGTGNNIDLATATNYNLRYDGGSAELLNFASGIATVADLNSNGKSDLIMGAGGADYNSRTSSGSLYIIYDSLIDDYTGTGNNIDLATATNYNLRYDGAVANEQFGTTSTVSDLDNDGKQDVVVGSYGADYNSRTNSGSVWVIYNTLIDDYTGTGNNIDLATATNYNLRYDGAVGSDWLTISDLLITTDLDSDSKQDILIGTWQADFNSRSSSGSLYIIYNTLIDDYTGTGNNIDLATATNYNLRYDGAEINGSLTRGSFAVSDFFGTGKNDLVVSDYAATFNSRSGSGGVYVVANTLIDDYTGTGNNIDMSSSANYTLRYDGPVASERLGTGRSGLTDIDGDGSIDLVLPSVAADNNSRTDSGSIYIIYNFPHTLSLTSISTPRLTAPSNITGTLTATNSTTNISSIEWGVTNSYSGTWTACTADDDSFNSTTEAFTCSLGTVLEGGHNFYIRGYDTNSSYTVKGSYGRSNFIFDSSLPQGTFTTSNGDKVNFSLILPKDKEYIEDNLPEFNFFKAKDNISGIERYQIILTNTQTKETDSNHKDNYVYIDNIDPNSPGGVETDGKAIENSSGSNNGESSRTRDQIDKKVIYSGYSIKVKAKRDNDKLDKGIYKWKVRAIDFAGNRIDSEERILNIGSKPESEKEKVKSNNNNAKVKGISTNTKQIKGINTITYNLEPRSYNLEANTSSFTPTPIPTPTLTSPPTNIEQPLPNQTPNPSSFLNIFNFLSSLKKLLPF